jgi:hypothetical protein
LGSKHAAKSSGRIYSLVRNSLKGSVIVKTKVTCMNDMVRASLLRELVKRLQVACFMGPINTVSLCQENHCQKVITSHVCNAQDPCRTALNHSAIVGEKRRGTGDRARSGTIRDRVALSTEVGAGLEMRRK